MDKIPKELQKIMTRLEQSYIISSTIYDTVVIKDAKNKAINAYTEICGLSAKSVDDTVELKLEFHPQHERQKKGMIKDVSVSPNTDEARDRVTKDLLEACV